MSAPTLPFSLLQGRRVHLGVCGSIAAYKAVEIMRILQRLGITVNVTLTEAATRFIAPLTFEALGAEMVYTAMFGQDDGLVFAHLQPGRASEVMLIAPATATTLARLAHGQADEILCAQALAFPGPVVIAPAMNPHMWANAATQHNVAVLQERGMHIITPQTGIVACKDEGEGKLADVADIAMAACRALLPCDMQGKKVMVTLGPTQEQWDGVRVWTNLSTGRMGAALVQAASLRGAEVHAVAGPGVPPLPSAVHRHDVRSAKDMHAAAAREWFSSDIGIFTAAVADFAPEAYGAAKFKKSGADEGFSVRFLPNPDILADLASRARPEQRILGFAAETQDLEAQVRSKLLRKKAHMIAGNLVGGADAGFATATNTMFVCDATGKEEHWPTMSKADVAWSLLDWLLTL